MRIHRFLGVGCVALVIAGALFLLFKPAPASQAAQPPAPPFARWLHLAESSEQNVTVSIDLERDSNGVLLLAATYTPNQPGFHLYGKDLPRDGAGGLGRPTLLELSPTSAIIARGGLIDSAEAFTTMIEFIDEPMLIYPDGPVTLRMPIVLPPGDGRELPDSVQVSYMTCNTAAGLCTPPVINKQIPVAIPSESKGQD